MTIDEIKKAADSTHLCKYSLYGQAWKLMAELQAEKLVKRRTGACESFFPPLLSICPQLLGGVMPCSKEQEGRAVEREAGQIRDMFFEAWEWMANGGKWRSCEMQSGQEQDWSM